MKKNPFHCFQCQFTNHQRSFIPGEEPNTLSLCMYNALSLAWSHSDIKSFSADSERSEDKQQNSHRCSKHSHQLKEWFAKCEYLSN